MALDNDKLFKAIVDVLKKSPAKAVSTYCKETCCDSLRNYNCLISTQSDYFYEKFIYFVDEKEQLIYVEHGWGSGAHQILLNFKINKFRYDTYEYPDDPEEYPDSDDFDSEEEYEAAEEAYLDFWEEWNDEHDIEFSGNIFKVLAEFDKLEEESFNGALFTSIISGNFNMRTEVDNVTKDFIFKINETAKLATTDNDEQSIEAFITGEKGSINIYTVDTKVKLITIEKIVQDGQEKYKFIVDITNDEGESFSVKSFIESKDQLNTLIKNTVDALNNYHQFSKYADDLENCLQ